MMMMMIHCRDRKLIGNVYKTFILWHLKNFLSLCWTDSLARCLCVAVPRIDSAGDIYAFMRVCACRRRQRAPLAAMLPSTFTHNVLTVSYCHYLVHCSLSLSLSLYHLLRRSSTVWRHYILYETSRLDAQFDLSTIPQKPLHWSCAN